MSVSTYFLAPLVLLALVGLVASLSAAKRVFVTLKRKRSIQGKPRALPVVKQGPRPLLDEPPAKCIDCPSTEVLVCRSTYTPKGDRPMADVEHFRCAQGHAWFGPGQADHLRKRLVLREMSTLGNPETLE